MLDGLSKPEQIAARVLECGYEGSALTDHGVISGCPGFMDVMAKKKLKPVAGCEFYICQDDATIKGEANKALSHLCVLAKNARGWKNLMRASSASFRPEFSYRKPRLDIERLGAFGEGEFITFSGHLGSDLANVCFTDYRKAYGARTYDDAKALVAPDWGERVRAAIARYQKAFGKENFYLEIQLVDAKNIPAALVVARILRAIGKKLGVPRVATADSHYCTRDDANDQRVLLCVGLNTTMKEVHRKLAADEDVQLGAFFRSNNYHIPSPEEIEELHKECPDELATSLEIAGRCETFGYGGKPLWPDFPDTNGLSQDEYLTELCKKGWAKLVEGKVPKSELETYRARLWNKEMPVIAGTNGFLASYFNVKADIIRFAREDLKVKTGLGRGSAAGCLVSYLTGITRLDPIPYCLIFERFYNAGRNSPGRIALPDIDSDFPIGARDKVIDYIRTKYGADKVAQMATFGRMQGKEALKSVFRAHDRLSFDEMNLITEHIPDESEIADQLQVMMEETGEASIIMWALKHNGAALKQWAFLTEVGDMGPLHIQNIDGPLALDFAQAVRLEGTKRTMGKHASGLIVCSEPLADICPMCWDKGSEEMMVAVDMRDAEKMGLVKLDILGSRTLDCIADCESFIRTGRAA